MLGHAWLCGRTKLCTFSEGKKLGFSVIRQRQDTGSNADGILIEEQLHQNIEQCVNDRSHESVEKARLREPVHNGLPAAWFGVSDVSEVKAILDIVSRSGHDRLPFLWGF